MGVTVPPGHAACSCKNVAAVMVTAQLPPFAQPGQTHRRQRLVAGQRQEPARRHADRHAAEGRRRPDLRARARQPDRRRRGRVGRRLQGADQPPDRRPRARGRDGRAQRADAAAAGRLRSSSTCNASDFNTAREVARAINAQEGSGTAQALDGRVVRVRMPASSRRARRVPGRHREPRRSTLATPAAKVVLNARTGSVVMNEAVTLGACAVAHGNLSVTISSTPVISQPDAVRTRADRRHREGRHHDHSSRPAR